MAGEVRQDAHHIRRLESARRILEAVDRAERARAEAESARERGIACAIGLAVGAALGVLGTLVWLGVV